MSQIAGSGARFAVEHRRHRLPVGQPDELRRPRPDAATTSAACSRPTAGRCPGARSRTSRRTRTTAATAPFLQMWPSAQTAAAAGGRFQMDTYCCTNGTSSASYPSVWYAFDQGGARFYVLDASWADSNNGTATIYQNDYDNHWTPSEPGVPVAPARPGQPPRLAEARVLPLPALRRQLDRDLGHVPAGPDQPRRAAAQLRRGDGLQRPRARLRAQPRARRAAS